MASPQVSDLTPLLYFLGPLLSLFYPPHYLSMASPGVTVACTLYMYIRLTNYLVLFFVCVHVLYVSDQFCCFCIYILFLFFFGPLMYVVNCEIVFLSERRLSAGGGGVVARGATSSTIRRVTYLTRNYGQPISDADS